MSDVLRAAADVVDRARWQKWVDMAGGVVVPGRVPTPLVGGPAHGVIVKVDPSFCAWFVLVDYSTGEELHYSRRSDGRLMWCGPKPPGA